MRISLKILIGVVAVLTIALGALWLSLPGANDRQTKGELALPGLNAPVRVVRDKFSTPYIFADSIEDALRAQGFVVGQDRLFQLEAAKRAATGRLAEVFGPGANNVILNLDREARVIGFHRLATRQEAMLSLEAQRRMDAYLGGLNAYISTRAKTHPMEFKLAGFQPETWTAQDLLAVVYYLGWASAANFDAELIAQRVIESIGAEAFQEIAPLVINPDDPPWSDESRGDGEIPKRWAGLTDAPAAWTSGGWRQQGYGGSNNWAISGAKAGAAAAIVTNDPHLDSRNLPGPWHPVGLITPTMRVVGVSSGLPGIVIGRNDHVAFGVTNAYADAVDLYVETIDPNDDARYLEGDLSLPFETITEIIRIRDSDADGEIREEPLVVRLTRRGPVITDHDSDLGSGFVLSMRWAAAEYMGSELGLDSLMTAQTIEEALSAVQSTRFVSLNYVLGDVGGRIARHATGAAPIRLRGDGMAPFPIVDSVDNWGGPIPPERMPGEIDPERGWTGTANHMTAAADYPYVYTTFASPGFRYRRIKEILSAPSLTAEDVWSAQYDIVNLFARDMAPIFSEALSAADDAALQDIGEMLANWDYRDDQGELAPTIFQEVVRQLAQLTFEDELGADATEAYLSNWYVWQERFYAIVQAGDSPWFDDTRTPEVEDRAAMIRRAGKAALDALADRYGKNRSKWRWGAVHQLHFQGPLRQKGFVGRLTGNASMPTSGSGETLLRALYPYHEPFDAKWFASLRMTADLNDPDKVRAVLPGGAVGRSFNPHLADQMDDWAKEEAAVYWWFSDDAIKANAKSELILMSSANE